MAREVGKKYSIWFPSNTYNPSDLPLMTFTKEYVPPKLVKIKHGTTILEFPIGTVAHHQGDTLTAVTLPGGEIVNLIQEDQ